MNGEHSHLNSLPPCRTARADVGGAGLQRMLANPRFQFGERIEDFRTELEKWRAPAN